MLVEVTIRLPCRPVGIRPGCRRPCPFGLPKFVMGMRDIRKLFKTPFSTAFTRAGHAFVIEVVGSRRATYRSTSFAWDRRSR